MNIVIDIVLLLAGFVLLIKGADFFVEGASSLARKLRIPSLVVGLTIVALGTSAPELAVSISASLGGQNSMAVSNVVGSNIFNLLGVLGVCALVIPLGVTKDILHRDYPVSIFTSVLFFVMLIFFGASGEITIFEAILLVVLMAGYLTWTVIAAMKNRQTSGEQSAEKPFIWWKCALFIICGAGAIVLGGDMVVDHASLLGKAVGMSESLVGLTICAVGTISSRTCHVDLRLQKGRKRYGNRQCHRIKYSEYPVYSRRFRGYFSYHYHRSRPQQYSCGFRNLHRNMSAGIHILPYSEKNHPC